MTDLDDLAARLRSLPAAKRLDEPMWRACADMGFTNLPVDATWCGRGATLVETAERFAAFGRAGAPPAVLFALGAQLWSVTMVVARFGTDEQRQRWLPSLCSGDVVAGHAMTEPSSGSDAFALTTTATAAGEEVVIDGSKTFVTNGPKAHVFLVFATASRALGWAGISAYLVERDTPGVMVGPAIRTMSSEGAGLAEINFDGCVVPITARVGPDGSGLSVFTTAMELERSLLAASLVGVIENRLLATAGRRRDAVTADRVAALWARRATAWALIHRAAATLDRGRKAPTESALAKLATSELWRATAALAVDSLGASGMLAGAEADLADAAAACIYSGTSEIQREVLGRRLKLPA